jgi:hypothetical protein
MSTAALVLAHWRGVWNQTSREAGQGAKIGGAIVIGVVAVFLLPISVGIFNIARSTGASMAASNDAGVLAFWAGEQALFAVLFPLCGAFRVKPAFPVSRFGRFPATRFELLLAEIPASLVEAFPILGIGGVVATNAGLAVAMPRMIPAIAVVTATSVCWFIATMFIGSALVALLARSRASSVVAISAAFALAAWAGIAGMRTVFRLLKLAINAWLPAAVGVLPLTRGYEGILALHNGDTRRGLTLIAFYAGATALIAAIAVPLHSRRLSAENEPSRWRAASARRLRFDTPVAGIGALYFRQLLGSGVGRTVVVVSIFMTGTMAFVLGIMRAVESEGTPNPIDLVRTIHRIETIPWFAAFPLFLVVAIGSQIWTNQFGFDASSLRGILALPVSPQQILLGKTFGLAKYFAVQLGGALLPVLAFAPPTPRHAISGAAVAVLGTVVAAALGQALSVRFPRSFGAGASAGTLPLYLSWIPMATLMVLGAAVFVLSVIGDVVWGGTGPALLVAAAIGSCMLYRAALPRLAAWMMEHRERLVTM